MPLNDEMRRVYIQCMFNDFNDAVAAISKMMNELILSQNVLPNLRLKILLAMKNCIAHVTNCTQRLVNAAPLASKIGMNIKFKVKFVITPMAATIFNCLRFPLAVNNVPKIYVTDIDTKLPIKICNILEDSVILMLYISTNSFSFLGYSSSIRFLL